MIFSPHIEGEVTNRSSPAAFAGALRERVAEGLMTGPPHPRSGYAIAEEGASRLRVEAVDWSTAINVGLNNLEIRLDHAGSVHYSVRYWRWAAYALGLSAAIGLIGILVLIVLDLPAYLERNPRSTIPGLTPQQHLPIALAMFGFWGFIWPSLLTAMHKRPLHQLVHRILGEVDAKAREGSGS